MQISTCMWGGHQNPIIPVLRTVPEVWREDGRHLSGREITQGYIRFFEPDAYVEASEGLLEKAGLQSFRDDVLLSDQFTSLAGLFDSKVNGDAKADVAFGLNIIDLMHDIHERQRQFILREPTEALEVKSRSNDLLAEAIFGVYPSRKDAGYLLSGYRKVFEPSLAASDPETWRKAFVKGLFTPRQLSGSRLEYFRKWRDDLVIFVFEQNNPLDIIDLWNLRLEPSPVLPVPVDWWDELKSDLEQEVRRNFRPLKGNNHGVMHRTTFEFARSLSKSNCDRMIKSLSDDLPERSWSYKHWRNRIWETWDEDWARGPERLEVTAADRWVTVDLKKDTREKTRASFDTLAPSFASRFTRNGNPSRWVNVVDFSSSHNDEHAFMLPFNTFDPSTPRLDYLGKPCMIGSEGFAFSQRHSDSDQTVQLMTHHEAVKWSLERAGVQVVRSDAGKTAEQVLINIGGLWGAWLLKNSETLDMLNEMTRGQSRFKQTSEWFGLIQRRKKHEKLSRISLDEFTQRNILRLGVISECENCSFRNWHALDVLAYTVSCERCLSHYAFPQGSLAGRNRNWAYRTSGPFSVPDYSRGSYGVVLTLSLLNHVGDQMTDMTFSTGVEMKIAAGKRCEADFVAWIDDNYRKRRNLQPELVFGETKSFGKGELIKKDDLDKLRIISQKFPGSFIVISVLRESFTKKEQGLLKQFVQWARASKVSSKPRNPVILLTGTELFAERDIDEEWAKVGGKHAEFAHVHHTETLMKLAEATQQIYLDMASFSADFFTANPHLEFPK